MNIKRVARISEEVKKVVSELLLTDLKDPRISSMTSVTHVDVTNDLSYAKIYISVLGSDEEKQETIKGLKSAKGFVRKEISKNIDIRYTPQPIFILDESIERGVRLTKLIEEVNKDNGGKNE